MKKAKKVSTRKRKTAESTVAKKIHDRLKRVMAGVEPPVGGWRLVEKTPQDLVASITATRGSVYGPFLHNAIVAQAIKSAMRKIPDPDNEGASWEALPIDIREGLDLIALKISRIICGDHEYLDNWDDIGGYAKIVADRIRASRVVP